MKRHDSPNSVRSVEPTDVSLSSQHNDSLGNGSIESQTSIAEGDQHPGRATSTRAPKLRQEIAHIREQVIMSRLDLRERRVEMREQHALVRSLEVQILRYWQNNEAGNDQAAVKALHGKLCAALDQLGPMEADYDEKEDGLDTLEFDLEAKERRFYRHYALLSGNRSLG
ncbi:MAG: hypothetical protein L6R39_005998, partial [Caloplaca ligustica]